MNLAKSLIILLLSVGTGWSHAATKSDLAKEKRWEDQIMPSLLVGDAVRLKAKGTEFLGLYTEAETDKAMGGILLLHGIGLHPAWPDVIEPLRSTLPEYGWHTLSLQLPVLKNEAEPKDYPPLMDETVDRLKAGVAYLKKKGMRNIVIIAHSLGTAPAGYYLSSKPDRAVRGYVGVSMGYFPFDKRFNTALTLQKIKVPTLDIFGSQDFDENVRDAIKRKQGARKAKNKGYQQLKVEGANHFFSSSDDVLTKRVRGWLKKNAHGTEIKK